MLAALCGLVLKETVLQSWPICTPRCGMTTCQAGEGAELAPRTASLRPHPTPTQAGLARYAARWSRATGAERLEVRRAAAVSVLQKNAARECVGSGNRLGDGHLGSVLFLCDF